MMLAWVVFLPFVWAFVAYCAGRKSEAVLTCGTAVFTAAELLLSLFLIGSTERLLVPAVFADGLSFAAGGFRSVYSVVTSVMWAGTSLFSVEYFREERQNLNRYYFFVLLTLGATQGVMLSADLMTAFVFFEILSFTSFTWVIHEETPEAVRAAKTYLAIAVIGGLILFMGLLLMQHACGTLVFSELKEAAAAAPDQREVNAAGLCILFGFGAKAGMFPLHVWLPKAHPVAPAPASALLSGILTKVGVYGILMTTVEVFAAIPSYGMTVLFLGLVTMALGAVLAVFSVNLKRTLACSSMSQIGFILTGIGTSVLLRSLGDSAGAAAALSGAVLHMVNHSLLKLCLFLAAGVVFMNLHALDLNEIRGWGRDKTLLKISFALGGLGISGVPFFNGYISKTLLHEGITAGIRRSPQYAAFLRPAEWIFLISGGLTFAYMLKLFVAVFVEPGTSPEKNGGERAEWKNGPERNTAAERKSQAEARTGAGRSLSSGSGKGRTYMNAASAAAVCGAALSAVILGQPPVMKKLAGFMTGSAELEAFSAFAPENLQGSLISLLIGGLIYAFFVRTVLLRNGRYVNLWPEKLDLENAVYRPLLLGFLPAVLGAAASVFGENKVLKPVSKAVMKAYAGLADLFGENRLLVPLSRLLMFLLSLTGRAFSDSTDALIVLTRKTVLCERPVTGSREPKTGRLLALKEATKETADSVFVNFSFSLVMTCIGICLIFGILFFLS